MLAGMPKGTKAPRIVELAQRWQATKATRSRVAEQEDVLKKEINDFVEAEGYEDDKGHQWFDLGTEVLGYDTKGKEMKFNALQRQKRVSLQMNEETAEAIAAEAGILDEVTKSYLQVTDPEMAIEALRAAGLLEGSGIEILTSIDQDALVTAWFDDKITKEQYAQIFTEKVTFALYTQKV